MSRRRGRVCRGRAKPKSPDRGMRGGRRPGGIRRGHRRGAERGEGDACRVVRLPRRHGYGRAGRADLQVQLRRQACGGRHPVGVRGTVGAVRRGDHGPSERERAVRGGDLSAGCAGDAGRGRREEPLADAGVRRAGAGNGRRNPRRDAFHRWFLLAPGG